jgi:hypothetical protein
MKTILILFALIALLNARQMLFTEHKQYLNDIVNNMRAKYCNMRGFRGQVYCPGNPQQFSDSNSEEELTVHTEAKSTLPEGMAYVTDSFPAFKTNISKSSQEKSNHLILSGFGYDRVKRYMKYPVFSSSQAAAVGLKVDHTVEKFNTVREFLNHVYSQKNQFLGGLVRFYLKK